MPTRTQACDAIEVAIGAPLAVVLAAGVVQLLPPPARAQVPDSRPPIVSVPAARSPRYVMAAAAAGTVAR